MMNVSTLLPEVEEEEFDKRAEEARYLVNLADRMKELASPTRLKILSLLNHTPMTMMVKDLVQEIEMLEQPTISHHISGMRVHHLVELHKVGLQSFYSVQVDEIIETIRETLVYLGIDPKELTQ